MEKMAEDMSEVSEQGVAVHAHHGDDAKRDQRHHHDHDPHRGGHGNQHELRVAQAEDQNQRLNGVSRLDHAAEELAGVGKVRRDGVYVVEFLFFHLKYVL